jgi:hypothetical protein
LKSLAVLFANLGAIACFIFAGLLAYRGKSGWGWFLFVGVLISATSIEWGDKDKDQNNDKKTNEPGASE